MEWLPYPAHTPKQDREYLVSVDSFVTVAQFNRHTKLYNEFGEKYFGPAWHDLQEGGIHYTVTAFMEKPKPYIGE